MKTSPPAPDMHWRRKSEPGPEFPHGTTRIISRFAWLPTTMSDNVTVVWLERYGVEQEFRPFTYAHKPKRYDAWVDTKKFLPSALYKEMT